MYYSSGNYEAFARPKKPEGVDNKSAYIVGSGLAALTAACYLVRDGQMKGEHVLTLHLAVTHEVAGGSQRGEAAADDIGGLVVHAFRLLGTGERFIVTAGIIHKSFLLSNCL